MLYAILIVFNINSKCNQYLYSMLELFFTMYLLTYSLGNVFYDYVINYLLSIFSLYTIYFCPY